MDLKKYFTGSGKKSQLSDNSTNDDDPEKQREISLNDSQNVDDTVAERLSSPDCVAIVVICVKNAENRIIEMFGKTEESKSIQIKGEQHLMELNRTIINIQKVWQLRKRKKKIINEMRREM